MHVSKIKGKSVASAFAICLGAACASMAVTSPAVAWGAHPGGPVTLSGQVTMTNTNPIYATSGVTCPMTLGGNFDSSTGNLTITSGNFTSDCSYSVGSVIQGVTVDQNQFPLPMLSPQWSGSSANGSFSKTFRINLIFVPVVDFSPAPPPSTCEWTSNLLWNNTQHISSSPPTNQATLTAGFGYASDGQGGPFTYACSVSGVFTLSPPQTITY